MRPKLMQSSPPNEDFWQRAKDSVGTIDKEGNSIERKGEDDRPVGKSPG
jgi:hypothetical protein